MSRVLAAAAALPRPAAAPEEVHDAHAASIVAQLYPFVWRLLRRMGVPEPLAEDAAQEVFCVFWRRRRDVRAGSERAFLCGTALQVARGTRRSGARASALGQRLASCPDDRRAQSPFDAVQVREVLDRLLDVLPEELRVVFVLCAVEELTMAEASTLLGVPPGTVASRLRRARESFAAAAAAWKEAR